MKPSLTPLEADNTLRFGEPLHIQHDGWVYCLVGPTLCPLEMMAPCAIKGTLEFYTDNDFEESVTEATRWMLT